MAAPTEPAARRRLADLDGLRGAAIVLVLLSHGWILHDYTGIDANRWWRAVFRSGNAGVTVFLVAAGFLAFRGLGRAGHLVGMRPAPLVVRRILRVGPVLWAMLATVLVVAAVDSTDPNTWQVNRTSVLRVLTYTYNWLIEDDIGASRPDFGHLWYLSVEMQAFLMITVVIFLLRRRPAWLLGALAALYVVLVAWRFHSYATENIFTAYNRTTTRMDAFVVGTMVGAATPFLPRDWTPPRFAAPALAALMLPLVLWCSTDGTFLRWGGTALELVVGAFVLVSSRLGQSVPGLSHPLLVRLGRESLVVYVWHFPVLWFVERHLEDAPWFWAALAALALTGALSVVSVVLLERPMGRMLARPGWTPLLRDGFTATAVARLRSRGHQPEAEPQDPLPTGPERR